MSRRARDRELHARTVAAHGRPPTRTERIRARMEAGDWAGALKAAARLGSALGPDRDTIQRAWEASSRPDFYRQIGRDPDALVAAGVEALRRLFL